jgi:hypothetical protein
MPINHSHLSQVAGYVHQELMNVFSTFKELELVSGESSTTDAFLLAVIESPNLYTNTYTQAGSIKASQEAPNLMKGREDLLVPSQTKTHANLKLYLVRQLNKEQKEYFNNDPAKLSAELIVLNENVGLDFTYTQYIADGEISSVNASQSLGSRDFSLREKIKAAIQEFEQLILSAF